MRMRVLLRSVPFLVLRSVRARPVCRGAGAGDRRAEPGRGAGRPQRRLRRRHLRREPHPDRHPEPHPDRHPGRHRAAGTPARESPIAWHGDPAQRAGAPGHHDGDHDHRDPARSPPPRQPADPGPVRGWTSPAACRPTAVRRSTTSTARAARRADATSTGWSPPSRAPRATSCPMSRRPASPTPVPALDSFGCPDDVTLAPSRIRISLYSIADRRSPTPWCAAHRRCVSVQLLMNNHLDEVTSRSWGIDRRTRRRGGRTAPAQLRLPVQRSAAAAPAVLHSKFFLFDAAQRHARPHRDGRVLEHDQQRRQGAVRTTCSRRQRPRRLYDAFTPDVRQDGARTSAGRGRRSFHGVGHLLRLLLPLPRRDLAHRPDHARAEQRPCTGANGGAGINGRSVIYINMHAWHGTRGLSSPSGSARCTTSGCYVRILYSFMGQGTFTTSRPGHRQRMVVRRVLFSGRPAGRGGEVLPP